MSEVANWKEKSVLRLGLNKARAMYWSARHWQRQPFDKERARALGFEGRFGYLLIEVWLGCNIMAWKGIPFLGPPPSPTHKQFFTYDDQGFVEITESTFTQLFATFDEKLSVRPFRYIRIGMPSNLMYVYLMELYLGFCGGGHEDGYAVVRGEGKQARLRLGPDPDNYHLHLM